MRYSSLFVAALVACSRPDPRSATSSAFIIDTFATAETVPFERLGTGVVLPDHRLLIADRGADKVFLLDTSGALVREFGTSGNGPGELEEAGHVVLRGDTVSVLNAGNARVERFLLSGEALGSVPLPPNVQYRDSRLLPGDSVVVTTVGSDSALALLQDATGHTLARYGVPEVPPSNSWNFSAMREEITAGKIPQPFRNSVTPVVDLAGDVWLIHHTESRIDRFARNGERVTRTIIPDSLIAPIRAQFIRANREETRPGVLRLFSLATGGAALDRELWIVTTVPDSLPPTLLRIDSTGAIAEQQLLVGAEGARLLVADPDRTTLYAIYPGEGIIFRLRRPR